MVGLEISRGRLGVCESLSQAIVFAPNSSTVAPHCSSANAARRGRGTRRPLTATQLRTLHRLRADVCGAISARSLLTISYAACRRYRGPEL